MVILDGSFRSTMLTNGGHHYIQPDPFSPAQSAMDSKSSPLAMLQKTCSQIGADTAPAKPLITADKKKDEPTARKEPPAAASPAHKPTFKPYDLDRKEDKPDDKPEEAPVRGRKSPDSRKTPKSDASSSTSSSGASPITRPGAEVLAGCGAKELAGFGLHKPGALPLPLPAYLPADLMVSAALRPTLPGLPGLYSQAGLSAAAYLGLQQHRPGEKCQSPYCACGAYGAPHGYGAACPAGCAQCEHAKALGGGALPSPYLALASPFYPPPTSLGFGLPAGVGATAGGQPIVCSWMSDGRYCGKRFAATEELMQHLRTHTSLSAAGDSALAALHPAYHASLAAAHRSPFAPPPLSPLSAARYHPYSKPAAVPAGLALPAPYPAASLAAAYYSPYSTLYARPPTLP